MGVLMASSRYWTPWGFREAIELYKAALKLIGKGGKIISERISERIVEPAADSVTELMGSMFETVGKITGFFEFTTSLFFFFVKNPMMLVFIGFTMALVMSITAKDPIDWMGKMAHNIKEIILFFVLVLSEIGSMLLGALRFIRELLPV